LDSARATGATPQGLSESGPVVRSDCGAPAVKIGNTIRLDLQKVGVQMLSEAERQSLYGRRF
jgi:hypothetical protein